MESPASITIQIEVLEVEGLSHSEAPRFQRAVEQELARLVAERGLSAGVSQARSHVEVAAGMAGAQERDVAQVALAIYQALGQ